MAQPVTLHRLDSADGQPLESWTFEKRGTITIGRSPENDVILEDPYVARAHVYLKFDGAQWRLISLSRRQFLHEGRGCAEVTVEEGTVFQLGTGCYLRFGQAPPKHVPRPHAAFEDAPAGPSPRSVESSGRISEPA